MTTDNCGAQTGAGEPCQNPATEGDSCWIDSHGGDVQTIGRQSKFSNERARQVLSAARDGLSEAGCGRAAGVSHTTISRWKESNPTYEDDDGEEHAFRAAFRRARSEGETTLVRNGLYDEDVDSSMAKFLLASSYDYKKTEKREVTGEGGGPVEIEISETIVETPHSDEGES